MCACGCLYRKQGCCYDHIVFWAYLDKALPILLPFPVQSVMPYHIFAISLFPDLCFPALYQEHYIVFGVCFGFVTDGFHLPIKVKSSFALFNMAYT